MDTDSNQVRLGAIGIVALSLFLALFARLWFLQGIERQEFEATSVSNRLRVIQTEGPRGRILDRNGKVVVDNRTTIVVALDREPLRDRISGLDERDPDDVEAMREELWPDFERAAFASARWASPPRPRASGSGSATSGTRPRSRSRWPRTSLSRSSSTSPSGPRTSRA